MKIALGTLLPRFELDLVEPGVPRTVFRSVILAPEGATLEYTDRYVRQAEEIYKTVPEVDRQFAAIISGRNSLTRGAAELYDYRQVKQVIVEMERDADLTREIDVRSNDETGHMATALNAMFDKFSETSYNSRYTVWMHVKELSINNE